MKRSDEIKIPLGPLKHWGGGFDYKKCTSSQILDKIRLYYFECFRFTIAAKHHQTIAEIFEGEGADLGKY